MLQRDQFSGCSAQTLGGSHAFVLGVAFLAEGADAFAGVLGAAGELAERFTHAEGIAEGDRRRTVRHLFRCGHGLRRVAGEAFSPAAGLGHEVFVRDDSVHEAHVVGAGGVDAVADKEQLERGAEADDAGGADGAGDGGDADLDLGELEDRLVGGDAQVASEGKRKSLSDAIAVDGGDGGLPDFEPALEVPVVAGLPQVAAGTVRMLARVVDGGAPGTDVGASGEGAIAGAGDDGDPELGIVAKGGPGVVQLDVHRAVEGVECLRTIEGDPGDLALRFVTDGHGAPPL